MDSFLVTKVNGRLKFHDVAGFNDYVRAMGDGEDRQMTLEDVEERKTRKQEKGFHAMIQPWAKAEGHAIEDLKRDLLAEIFGLREHTDVVSGAVVLVLREPHTSTLSKKKYNELIERTLQIGAECGHTLIAPNEWREMKERERLAQRRTA